ncbi:PfaD family polyunsaturated fatty acid/polyketide biosynthesis protein [Streptantibioticus cattleyicolor]|uniref:2-nitropropane dioxygenase, NPD n=1 Tax=Streptantibioticus cattleyicolor (strain ATCC 35852 / DSM 46488 / JCM 4925 / NBRC 14057 / NRRL 8057) TaxID=1003195 RepID=F8JLQ9_STREN|nr:PfaD family polyunsaturated fatty acid/polyketide biosynthesis protein [Streptantibioticus cattleyicolor]AEW99511.1 2-nitropropane dioxygenase, NPD [Streptantibioticus cattleyicolor NRRL 8057 = DSM 46488]CCB71449.1 2-nitropropane dioxygenase, NPD [Streptantibioticus cattleyicolor NRRL 8057 = DSM 46488]
MTTVRFDRAGIRDAVAALDRPCYVVLADGRVGVGDEPPRTRSGAQVLATVPPVAAQQLGSAAFLRRHRLRAPYMAGSMAGGISSEDLVVALADAGCLASYGAAGLRTVRVERALRELHRRLPDAPWACNLIHNPADPRAERETVDLFLRLGVTRIEASAFMTPTVDLVRYRATGLRRDRDGTVHAGHQVIAKVSQAGPAAFFLRPAPAELVAVLERQGALTAEQAALAARVPLADDITVEADSAGHTDRRPLVTQLPLVLALRDDEARAGRPGKVVGVGAAGGIGTPQAAFAAFALGADYIVTGSVNQGCVEAGTSTAVKALLAEAGVTDCVMAPSADMFEMGVDVQVLRRGTLFPGRAAWLHRLYRDHACLDGIPAPDRARLEREIFRRPLEAMWPNVAAYLRRHHPERAERAEHDPRLRMALVFRWYLGLSSRWATRGDPARQADFQIWCGPAMGAFNAWVAGTAWSAPENRRVAEVAGALLRGAAYHSRLAQLRFAGVRLPSWCVEAPPPVAAAPVSVVGGGVR